MLNENYTDLEKETISKSIKNISLETVDREMDKLIKIGLNMEFVGPRSLVGNNIVDYFTFTQRLKTKGKYDINFFEFIVNIDGTYTNIIYLF